MSYKQDIAIADHRKRSARLLQEAQPNSAEQNVYQHINQVFEQDALRSASSEERVVGLVSSLTMLSQTLSPEAGKIARRWAEDFARDIDMPLDTTRFRRSF